MTTRYQEMQESILNQLNGIVGQAAVIQERILNRYSGDPSKFANMFINDAAWGTEIKQLFEAQYAASTLELVRSGNYTLEDAIKSQIDEITEQALRPYFGNERSTNAYSNAVAQDKAEVARNYRERLCRFHQRLQQATEADHQLAKDAADGVVKMNWRTMDVHQRSVLINQLKKARVLSKLPRDVKTACIKGTGAFPVVYKNGLLQSVGSFDIIGG